MDSITCLIVVCTILSVVFIAAHWIWNRYDYSFASISPSHKKWYVVANMSQCLFLGIMCVSPRYWKTAYRAFALDDFVNIEIKRTTVLYITTDAVALLTVPKLPKSTIVHHVTTLLLLVLHWGVDMCVKGWTGLIGVVKMMLLYGTIISIPSSSVCGYLALRVVYPNASLTILLGRIALFTYVVGCFGNWSLHLFWFAHSIYFAYLSLSMLLYAVGFAFFVYDDFVLMKWLIARHSPVKTVKNE